MADRLEFLKTSVETDGELLEVRATYAPGSRRPPVHYHPHQEEYFEILRGEMRAAVDGQEATYRVGDAFMVPRNIPHWMHNPGSEPAVVLWRTRPALRTEILLDALWNRDPRGAEGDARLGLLELAVILSEFQDEFRLANPPYPIQRALLGLLAFVGRTRGYRAPSSLG